MDILYFFWADFLQEWYKHLQSTRLFSKLTIAERVRIAGDAFARSVVSKMNRIEPEQKFN